VSPLLLLAIASVTTSVGTLLCTLLVIIRDWKSKQSDADADIAVKWTEIQDRLQDVEAKRLENELKQIDNLTRWARGLAARGVGLRARPGRYPEEITDPAPTPTPITTARR